MEKTLVLLSLFLLNSSLFSQNCDLEYLGAPGFSSSNIDTPSGPSVAIHPTTGETYVVYKDVCLSVRRFDGVNWIPVGGVCLPFLASQHQKSLMFDSSGELYLAISVSSITYPTEFELALYHYNSVGDVWEQVGDFLDVVNVGGEVCLKEHPISGELYIAYPRSELLMSFFNRTNVKRFDGTDWVQVGQLDISQDKAFSVSLDFQSDGTPILAYVDGVESEGNGQATVKKLNGNIWETVGLERFTQSSIKDITIHYDQNLNRITIVYIEDLSVNARTSAMYFDGFAWIYIGGPSIRISSGSSQALDFDFHPISGDPFVAASWDGSDCLYYFNGSDWVSLGGIQSLSFPAMVFHPVTNEPHIVFKDIVLDHHVSVIRFPCISGDGCILPGCMDITAQNYNSEALCDDESCAYLGCTYNWALNYDSLATIDDGTCGSPCVACPTDLNDDGYTNTEDLLLFLGAFGTSCE